MIEDTFNIEFSYAGLTFTSEESMVNFMNYLASDAGIQSNSKVQVQFKYKQPAANQLSGKYLKITLEDYEFIKNPTAERAAGITVLAILKAAQVPLTPYLEIIDQEALLFIGDDELDVIGENAYLDAVRAHWPNIQEVYKKTQTTLLYNVMANNQVEVLDVLVSNFDIKAKADWFYYHSNARNAAQLEVISKVPGFDINCVMSSECIMDSVQEGIEEFLSKACEMSFNLDLKITKFATPNNEEHVPYYDAYSDSKKAEIIKATAIIKERAKLKKILPKVAHNKNMKL